MQKSISNPLLPFCMEEPLFIQSNEIFLLTPTKSLKEITLSRGLQKNRDSFVCSPTQKKILTFFATRVPLSITHSCYYI